MISKSKRIGLKIVDKVNTITLFRDYPELEQAISHIKLGAFPTPVHQLAGLNFSNLWIKRDDQTSPVYGGNKVRKQEFILGDVIKKKKTRIITMGGLGTNHGLATAIFCKRAGLSCKLLLFDQPITKQVKQNLRLFQKYGAELIYAGSISRMASHFYFYQRLKHPNAYFLYAGGSTPIGTLGFVNAAFELKQQINEEIVPYPDVIFCPLGSNGTMAGLSLGVILMGLKTKVIGVRVMESHFGPVQLATPKTVKKLMEKTYRLLRSKSDSIPEVNIPEPIVVNDYFGDGYGCPTKEGLDAQELVNEKTGLKLDYTYTSKTFAAVLDYLKKAENQNKTVLYWHTYNSVDLSSITAQVDYHDLPGEFHRYFVDL